MSNETVCWWLVTTCVKAQLYFVFYFSIGKETVDPHQQHLHAKSMFSIELLWMRRYKLRVRGLVKWQTIQFLWSSDHIKHNNDVLTHNIYWMECMLSYCLLSQCLVNIFVHPTRDMMTVTWNALEPASSTRDCESMNFYFFFFFSIDIWIMMYIDEFGEIIQNATRIFSR